jgi:hypothetical protein
MAYGSRPDEDPEEDEDALPPPPPADDRGVIVGGPPAGEPGADPTAAGGGGKHGGGGAPDLGPQYNWPGLPGFVAPTFAKPTYEQVLQEPGYEFRLGAGRGALEHGAAARGVLRSGGTLRDILEYGQKFGAQEYGNVYNRALTEYDRTYQAAKDAYAPRLAQWQMQAQGELQRALAQYGRKGGGGGGGPYIPPDILGPPPQAPDYAHTMGGAAAMPGPPDVVPPAAAYGQNPYEDPYYRQY